MSSNFLKDELLSLNQTAPKLKDIDSDDDDGKKTY